MGGRRVEMQMWMAWAENPDAETLSDRTAYASIQA